MKETIKKIKKLRILLRDKSFRKWLFIILTFFTIILREVEIVPFLYLASVIYLLKD
jgi:hypothetical protein